MKLPSGSQTVNLSKIENVVKNGNYIVTTFKEMNGFLLFGNYTTSLQKLLTEELCEGGIGSYCLISGDNVYFKFCRKDFRLTKKSDSYKGSKWAKTDFYARCKYHTDIPVVKLKVNKQ